MLVSMSTVMRVKLLVVTSGLHGAVCKLSTLVSSFCLCSKVQKIAQQQNLKLQCPHTDRLHRSALPSEEQEAQSQNSSLTSGDGKHNQLAMGLDLRQASLGPGDDALFTGDPHNVPRRQGLNRMSSMQQQVLGDLLRVRTLVRQHTAKHDESRTQEYLYAAARGDTNQIQQVGLAVGVARVWL